MMLESGVNAWGAYVPRTRLERRAVVDANSWANSALLGRQHGTRSFCNWDEDSISMGVEAGRAALLRLDLPPQRLVFASTTSPFDDRPASVIAALALNAPENVSTIDQGRTKRAGTSALADSFLSASQSLVIASDACRASPGTIQEVAYGHAAAAIGVGTEGVVARCLGALSRADDFVDHYRAAGSPHEFHWEERWVRDEGIGKLVPLVVQDLLERTGVDAADITHFIFPTVFPGLSTKIAGSLGIAKTAVRDDMSDSIGESGCAHALLMLASTLDTAQPKDKILIVNFGNGCDAMILEVTEEIIRKQGEKAVADLVSEGKVESSYQKFLSYSGEVNIDFGLRFEAEIKTALSAQYRRSREFAAFEAGKCTECGVVQFPRSAICVNDECDHVGEQSLVSLMGVSGRIVSFTSDWLSFKAAPPFNFGLVQFDNGARVLMEFADFDPDQLVVGAPIRLVYRRKEIDNQRRYCSYFWKAAPAGTIEGK